MNIRDTTSRAAAGVMALLLWGLASRPVAAEDFEPPDRTTEASAIMAAEAETTPLQPSATAQAAIPQAVEVPILVYHAIRPGAPSSSAMMMRVSPEELDREFKLLRDNGYQTISFADLAECLERGKVLPEHPIILSFDDGWDTQFTYGFPALRKYGFTATFYVVSDYIDHPNFMSTDQLKTMIAAGNEIGSHTRSHPSLPNLGLVRRWDEIFRSKTALEEKLGMPVTTFAYPYGAHNAAVVATVKAAGYRTARAVDLTIRQTLAERLTLGGMTYWLYIRHYRDKVELAANEPRSRPR